MGQFVMIDGIEGAGKHIVMEEAASLFKHVFDLRAYAKEHGRFPAPEDIQPDVVLSVEPTYALVGRAIREEMLKSDYKYSALTTAHAFALDREMLYNKVILPLRKLGKTIIQERGIVSTLVYQPVQLDQTTLRDVMNIQGNKIAIKNAPDYLVIIKVDPEKVAHHQKKAFDGLFFARKIEERFEAEWLSQLFERFGTKVRYLDGNVPAQELREAAKKLFTETILGGQTTLA
ncbi:MAG: hypothetical protein Q7S65_04690 [Nanoarchaeota archaeon]|nr:hypothetical protein [Nanoarchaeota archaeon]